MRFRRNIALSVAVHAALIIAASGIVSGRDAASRVPADTISVALVRDILRSEISPVPGHKGTVAPGMNAAIAKKKKETMRPGQTESSEQNNYFPRQIAGEQGPEGGPQEKTMTGDGAGFVFQPQGFGNGENSAGHKGFATGAQTGEGNGGDRAGKQDAIGMIRSAIEKAKNYPPLARKRGIEGTATAEFTINSRGLPENIRILKSSGSDLLDMAAKSTVLRASPFPPINGGIEVPITFKIDKENLTP